MHERGVIIALVIVLALVLVIALKPKCRHGPLCMCWCCITGHVLCAEGVCGGMSNGGAAAAPRPGYKRVGNYRWYSPRVYPGPAFWWGGPYVSPGWNGYMTDENPPILLETTPWGSPIRLQYYPENKTGLVAEVPTYNAEAEAPFPAATDPQYAATLL